ncbi:MAG TPA: cytochrome c biogenesis protein CcsA, partial [Saprospiraceae bacterium]|nr:cytochrome c biogenesis protein CcsA [Saprospiraceae bacterium]
WWKYLAFFLLIYVIIGGIGIPLGPGIVGLDRFELKKENEYKVSAEVYNFSTEVDHFRAFLKFDGNQYLPASSIERLEESRLKLTFPSVSSASGNTKVAVASLLIEDESKGTAVLPDALRYTFSENGEAVILKGAEEINFSSGQLHIPFRNILIETIRNLFYHVPMWFSMIILAGISFYYSLRFLRKGEEKDDLKSSSLVYVALLLGVLGLVTGSIWAKNTWGTYWTGDVKLNMSALVVMMYAAYALMRQSISDPDSMKRNVAAYNIFCFVAMIPLLFIVPRLQDSLHPGNGGNPGFGGEDLDGTMRMVFYPAVIGWTLLSLWITNLIYRTRRLERKKEEELLNMV